ncbi:Uncharacterised protein [Candidatus Anstonella stagnisolia]|nr:Uncharacterised protein [Candidatus Anstonella stagnisolia]
MEDWIAKKRAELEAAAHSMPAENAEKKFEERLLAAIGKENAGGKVTFVHRGKNVKIVALENALSSDSGARSIFASALWKTRLAHFAAARFQDGLFVDASKNAEIEIEVNAKNGGNFYVLLLVEKDAGMNAIIRIKGAKESMGTIEAVLGENANANISVLSAYAENSTHFLQTCANVKRDAHLQWFVASFGGDGSAHAKNSLVEEGANCRNYGIFFPTGKERMVVRTGTRHAAIATFGDILTKSALAHESVLDYKGGVRIERNAVKSESDLNSRNIMLSDRCHVDAIPYLEIETNDVKASHGTSVGQLDEDEVFYLKSRGIGDKEAQKLVAMGFFAKMLQNCAGKAKEEIEKEIERCIDGS